jgi:hypothetical protein
MSKTVYNREHIRAQIDRYQLLRDNIPARSFRTVVDGYVRSLQVELPDPHEHRSSRTGTNIHDEVARALAISDTLVQQSWLAICRAGPSLSRDQQLYDSSTALIARMPVSPPNPPERLADFQVGAGRTSRDRRLPRVPRAIS